MARKSKAPKGAGPALPGEPDHHLAPEPAEAWPSGDEIGQLVRLARENPYLFFTIGDVAKICGFGPRVMTVLNSLGAPVIGRKCNPRLLLEWIGQNPEKIGKICIE
jgi:hypothetical protein